MYRPFVQAIRSVALIASCLGVTATHAQNLVANPDFNQGFPPPSWTGSNDGMCPSCAVQNDATNGHPSIPSIRLVSSVPGNAGQILTSSCIPYGNGIYDLGGFVRNNGSHVNAQPQMFFTFWSSPTCDGAQLAFEPALIIGSVGSWQQFGINAYNPPGTSGYVNILLNSRINGNLAGTASFSFDRIYFMVSDPIFSNGFE